MEEPLHSLALSESLENVQQIKGSLRFTVIKGLHKETLLLSSLWDSVTASVLLISVRAV